LLGRTSGAVLLGNPSRQAGWIGSCVPSVGVLGIMVVMGWLANSNADVAMVCFLMAKAPPLGRGVDGIAYREVSHVGRFSPC